MRANNYEKATSTYILNKSKDKILLLFHKKLLSWLPPGGHVEEGELIHESAKREVKEETGLDINFINIYDYFPQVLDERATLLPQPMLVQLEDLNDHYHEDFVYLGQSCDDVITNNENHKLDWFTFEEALKLNLFDNTKKHIEYIELITNKHLK